MKLIPSFMDEIVRFKVSEVIADAVEAARELELWVEPKDWTELLPPHLLDKILTGKGLFLMEEQRKWFLFFFFWKWFLEVESTPGEEAVRI